MTSPNPYESKVTLKSFLRGVFKVYFWLFNGILALGIYIGLLPFMAWQLFGNGAIGWVPWDFAIPLVGLVAVPTTIAVTTVKRPRTPLPTLFRLFYGIEMPLLFILGFRFFILHELNPATTFLLSTAVLGVAAFAHRNLWRDRLTPNWMMWLQMIGYGLLLATSLYLLGLYSFFALPLTISMVANSPGLILAIVILFPLVVIFFGFWTMPIGLSYLAVRDFGRMTKVFAGRMGLWVALGIGVLVPLGWVGSLATLQQQPQVQALTALAKPAQTASERQKLLGQAAQLRSGLLNAYLSKYRYMGVVPTNSNATSSGPLVSLYQQTFHVSEDTAIGIQRAFNWLASPFLYQGTAADSDKAAALYASFFDQPILRAEPDAVAAAVNATFDRTTMKAGLMDINQQKVLLTQQELKVTPHGDWADISIHEVYQNRTSDQQEVLYYFSLPESAAITGLWLGESNDLSKRFAFAVSPRGAAQQVYSNQLERRVDPALLEQVGPGSYRLRAFPVLPLGEKPMHLWLTYKALQQPGGGWPLPQLNERRNIFWNSSTQRQYNGQTQRGYQEAWFPTGLQATPKPAQTHRVTFASGDQLVAEPFTMSANTLPTGKQFAVVVDTSYSMGKQKADLQETVNWLKTKVLPKNKLDLYLTSAAGVPPQRVLDFSKFDFNQLNFYGTLQPKQMLAQFLKLWPKSGYDGILLLTDQGSYELTDNSRFQAALPAPLWMVHLGGLAPAYDDDTQQAIKDSRGGVVTEVAAAVERLQLRTQTGKEVVSILDGYRWRRLPATAAATPTSGANFMPVAARQLVQARSQELQPTQTAELDAIHAIATEHKIVTPYSSMIVLVNDEQRQELKEAENQDDRFNREVEDQQQLPKPGGSPEIAGVPEPQGWLLLVVGLGLLFLRNRLPLWWRKSP